MRIAFVVRRFPAFSETFIVRQIAGLMKRGHDVDIYAFKGDPSEAVHDVVKDMGLLDRVAYLRDAPEGRFARHIGVLRILLDPRFRHRRLALNVWRYGRGALASRIHWLNDAPKRSEYDVIHCQFAHNGVAAVWWRKAGLIDGRILTTFHGGDVVCDPRLYDKNGYDRLFAEGDHFTANSTFTADRVAALGCPAERITVWPMGVFVSSYEYHERSMPQDGRVRLLTVSRLVKQKGLEYSIGALAALAKDYPAIEYHIAGDGVDRRALEALIDAYGLKNRIAILGWKTEEQLRAIYRDAHLFIMPSITAPNGAQEAQGIALQEAQACGLPVVATRTGGIPEGILEGESGLLVPEKDSQALSDRIRWLLDHPGTWAEIGRAGRRYVEARFDMDKLTDGLINLYESMLSNTHCA